MNRSIIVDDFSLGHDPLFQVSNVDSSFFMITNCFTIGDSANLIKPPKKICGCSGDKGKCILDNVHKGKHRSVSGFEWF